MKKPVELLNREGYQIVWNKLGRPLREKEVMARVKGVDAYIDELRHFVDVMKRDVQPLVTGRDGKKVVEAVIAANKSIQTGQPVSFPL